MNDGHIPGVSVLIIKDNKMLLNKGGMQTLKINKSNFQYTL